VNGLEGRRAVVAGGAGAVGGLMADLLLGAGADVVVADPRAPEPADIRAPGPALAIELERADVVVLAVPARVAIAAVADVSAWMHRGALLVDTVSVKTAIVAEHATRHEALSLHPLFAPELGFAGRAVAAVTVRGGPLGRALLDAVRARGGAVAGVDADEHDRATAATQALTHAAVLAFGLALEELGMTAEELVALAPPPHLALLALLARISAGEPETYAEVQTNPHAPLARAALAAAATDLVDADFAPLLERARRRLGSEADAFERACERLFGLEEQLA
jgi:4-amino-4-deoxyprephenate dehydrogenase